MCATACIWESEDNLQEWVLSFCYVGPGDQTQILGSDVWCPFLLSHLTGSESESQPIIKTSIHKWIYILILYIYILITICNIYIVINKNMQIFTDSSFFPLFFIFETGSSYAAQGRLPMWYSSASASRELGYRRVPSCPASLRFCKQNLLYLIQ